MTGFNALDEARRYLIEHVMPKFSDSTFKDYITNKLAGDFAHQIATVYADQELKLKRLQEAILANTSRKAFREEGIWFMPINYPDSPGAAEQISSPKDQLYEALAAYDDSQEVIYRWRVDANRDWQIAESRQWLVDQLHVFQFPNVEIEALVTGGRVLASTLLRTPRSPKP